MTDAKEGNQAKDPEALREGIEQTREELGETVEALSAKADVKGQVQDKVEERKQAVKAKTDELREKVSAAVSSAQEKVSGGGGDGDDAAGGGSSPAGEVRARATQGASQAAQAAVSTTRQRPLPALGAAFGAGLLVGWLLGRD